MLWLFSAITAYFFLAIASVGDRFLLTGPLPSPKVYAFLISLLGGLIVPFLIPFGFAIPDFLTIIISLSAGFLWSIALVFYFGAISKSEVSRVVPAVGAFVPIFSFLVTTIFLHQTLSPMELGAFLLLLCGGFFITSKGLHARYFLRDHALFFILISAALLAGAFLLMKSVFIRESFVNGFLWMRIGGFVVALILLLSREVRRDVVVGKAGFQKQILLPFLLIQAVGGVGFVLQNIAIFFASVQQVPLVNALEGVRYLFLFLFVWLAARWCPEFLKEEMRGGVLYQKLFAGTIIILGIAMVMLS
jgi:drug/metabolite transporter (DMT)-like permease